ncbi:3-deoxy-D-manno-octulosonic acid transferase [Comamonas composti]|uniref:3-deoxy-D-manno-octulosonic acid transferase n=1 Tax=Comamonas composti TaxID=408558 RepID=UPI00041E6233|nr:3-deoxy-D-manno-octulosonic acid transferase [Comamonas composti]
MSQTLKTTLTRAAYDAATWAAQPLLLRKLARRARAEPAYGQHKKERFGRYEPADLGREGRGQWIWVHAVSLGETRAAAILLAALRERLPGMRLLLTNGTATGRAEGQRLLRAGDLQVWQPWDSAAAVRRFIRQFRPAMGLLMETEVWPNLVGISRQEGVPLALVNARLSEKSLASSLRIAALARPSFEALSAVWAQSEDDARRLRMLGARVPAVLGNLKFDARPDAVQLALAARWKSALPRPVVMLASSREGEEAQWISELQALGAAAAQVQWLIVPRHPQRFDEIAALLAAAGLGVSRRSQWADGPSPGLVDDTVWLGDSLGEMNLYYGLADLALMGGSFEPLGGQNLIEALACGCPVLLGPHTFNFSEASDQACEAGAALRVANMREALALALECVAAPHRLEQARAHGRSFLLEHQGAAAATAQAVEQLLKK